MKKNFNLDELEMFLSESAEQHRIYPSDRVWRNIDNELHGSKRWPALTFGAIFTGAVIIAGLIVFHPGKDLLKVNIQATVPAVSSYVQKNNNLTPAIDHSFSKIHLPYSEAESDLPHLSSNTNGSNEPLEAVQKKVDLSGYRYSNENFDGLDIADITIPLSDTKDRIPESLNDIQEVGSILIASANQDEALSLQENSVTAVNTQELNSQISSEKNIESIANIISAKEPLQAADQTIKKKKAPRWNMQFYASPSISYRYLNEAKIVDMHLPANGPLAPNYTNGVDKFVRHKPLLGMEVGTAIMYNVTPDFRLKTGLQFNYREYAIDAYASPVEPSTVLLNRGVRIDSLRRISSISSQGGYKPIEISNKYWQVAVPVGFDVRVAGRNRLMLFVAGSIQPTYQFNSSIYILSGDYKNYVQEPELIRHWNINTAIETFVSYKAAGLTWQAGPQIRYQMLPGTVSQYPVREHLIDYGIKIGVVKTLK